MSIRLHELAKKIGMDNKELLALLKARNYPVKTVSSTIDKITAEALEQEIGHKQTAPGDTPAASAHEGAVGGQGGKAAAAAVAEPAEKPPSFTTRLPQGVFVRSAQDIAREKEEQAKAHLFASDLFTEMGRTYGPQGQDSPGDAWSQIEKAAEGIVEKAGETKISKEAAIDRFLQTREGNVLYEQAMRDGSALMPIDQWTGRTA